MHWKRLVTVAIVGPAVVLTLAGCGRGTLATVNGEKITKDEFHKRLETMPGGANGMPAGFVVLDQMIQEELVMQLAKEMKLEPTEEQIEKKLNDAKKSGNLSQQLQQQGLTLEDFKDRLRVRQAYFNLITKDVKISDDEVRQAYAKAKDTMFTTPERVKVSAVVCKDKAKIEKAEKQIKLGTEFSSVVLNLSEDALSKQRKGEFDWLWRGRKGAPANLIEEAFKLKKNECSKPFRVVVDGKPQEWVIIKLLDRQPKKVRSYDEAKDQIREALMEAKGRQTSDIPKKIQKMRAEAKLKINVDKYKPILNVGKEQK